MKNGWQTKRLGELLDIQNGFAFSSKDYSESGHFVMRIGNVQNGYVALTDPKFIKLPADGSLERFVLTEGDILVSLTGNVGRVGVILEEHLPAALNQRVARISIRKGTTATRELLLFFLFSDWFRKELMGAGHGAAQQNVSTKDIAEIQIPIPPLPEQGRIVGILDEAFAGLATAKAHAEKNLQNARALFESYLQSVFEKPGKGWVKKSLGDLATFRNGINYTKDSKGECIKIVGVRNFQKYFSAPLDDLDTVTIDGKLSELDSLKQDDILAVRSNGNIELIGRCILVGEVTEKISYSGFTIRIRLSNGEVLSKYLCHFMKSASTRKLLTEGGTGTNIKSLNQGMLSALVIPVPPIPIQKRLVENLETLSDETQRLAANYRQKLAALDELKKSLLHQAFSGEL